MEESKKQTGFQYTYSAKEQEEIKRIRRKYQPKEIDKMEQLRRLDAGVTSKATTWALVLGILGVLVMGAGMSFAMTSLGKSLGMSGSTAMFTGILIGIFGMGTAAFAYPVYHRIVQKEREKITPEILRLTEELMK